MKIARLLFASVIAAFLLLSGPASAEDVTYTYDAGDPYVAYEWTRAKNWAGDHVPSSGANINMAGYSASYATGTVGNITLAGGRIDAASTSPGYFIIGGNVTGPGTITYMDLNTSGTTFDNGGGTLNLWTIYGNGKTPTFTGAGTTTFYMNGAGGLIKEGNGVLSGHGDYTGDTVIKAGTLKLTGGVGYGGSLSGKINLEAGSTLQTFYDGNYYASTLGEITGTGTVQNNNGGGGSASFKVGSMNSDFTFEGVIAGTGGFTKVGTGTMTLKGQSTFTGATTVTAGTLKLDGADALKSTPSVALNAGVMDISQSGAVNPAATLTMGYSGPAELRLSGASQEFSSLNSIGTHANSTIRITAGSIGGIPQYTPLAVGSGSYGGKITGDGDLLKTGAGTLYLFGSNTYTGKTAIAGGVLQLGSAATFASSEITLSNNGTLYLAYSSGTPPSTFSADITGYGGVTSQLGYASSVLTLTGRNEWTGTTYVNVGTLKLLQGIQTGAPVNLNGTLDLNNTNSAVGTVAGTGTINIGTGALIINQATDHTMNASIAGTTGSFTKTGAGKLTYGGGTYTGTTTVMAGTLVGPAPSASTVAVSSGAVYQAASAGAISGQGSVLYSGGFTCGANNQSTGFGGLIDIGTNSFSKSGTGTLSLVTGALLKAGSVSVSAGELAFTGGALGGATPPNLWILSTAATLNIAQGAHTFGNFTSTSYGKIKIGNGAQFTINNSSNGTYVGAIEGKGIFTKSGTGTLTLSGTNTFSGTTNIAEGTLNMTEYFGKTLTSSDVVVGTNGVLNVSNYDDTIGSLAGAGKVLLPAKLITGVNNKNTTYSGTMSGSSHFTKAGTGTMTLTGSSAHTGYTTVEKGQLTVSGGGSVMNSSYILIKRDGTLNLVNTAGGPMNMIGDAKTLEMYGGTLRVVQQGDGANTETFGTLDLRPGHSKIDVGGGGVAGIYAWLSRNTGATLTYSDNNGNRLLLKNLPTMSNNILSWALKDGEYATLDGYNLAAYSAKGYTYAADLVSATSTSNVRLTASGAHDLTAATTYANSLTTAAGAATAITGAGKTLSLAAILANGATDISASTLSIGSEGVIFANAPVTISSNITGTNLTKSGSSILTLAGSNTYTGATYVNEGTLIGPSHSIRGNINNYGTVVFDQAANGTYSGQLNGDGDYVKTGAGLLTLSASSSGTGTFRVLGGGLKLSSSISSMEVILSGGMVGGTGSTKRIIISEDGILSPGNSPGTMSSVDSVWDGGGQYLWEINNATGSQGTNWDMLSLSGQLAITATPTDKFTLDITSLVSPTNVAGDCLNFSSGSNYNWRIASASGGIIGFSQDVFNILIDDFTNPGASASNFYVYRENNDIRLGYKGGGSYAPTYYYEPYNVIGSGWWTSYTGDPIINPEPSGDVPEPSTLLLLLPFVGFGLRKLKGKKV